MRGDDGVMAVLTAVVVIIAVATLLPRDSTVMRALGLGATATARDDSFRLIAAGQATLDVMANDTGVDPARGDRLEVMAQPACGRVTPVGTKLRLEGFEACTGADSFRYCLRRDGACSTATVTLVIDGPDPVARVAPQPGAEEAPTELAAPMVTLGDHAAPVVTAVRADPPRPGPARPDLDLPAEAPPPPPPDALPAPVAAVPLPSRVAQGADPGDETARAAGPAAAPAMAEVPQAPLRPRTDPAPLAGPTAAPPVARSPVMAEAPPVPMPRPAEETGALAPLPPRPAPRAGLPEAPPTPDPAPGLAALRVPAAPGATPRLTAPAAGPEAPARDPAMAAPAMTVAGLRPARPDPARPAPPAAPDSAPPAAVAAVPPGPGPEPASRAPLVLSPGSGDAPARPVTAVLPERIPLAGPVAMAPAPESAPRPAPAAARPDSGMPMPAVPAEPVAETPLPALPPASIPPRSRTVAAPAAETPSRPPAADVVPAAAPVRDCPVALSMTPGPQQMLAVRLEAPCRSGEAVTLLHAGLKATVLLDSAGVARIDLPAMADPAKVETLFGDAAGPTASAAVPDLDRVARVALVWTGPADLDLHAFAPGTAGHVWEGAPGDPRAARRDGGAWMTTLGDPVAGGFRTEIISVPLGRRTPAAVLRLELGLAPGSACPEHVDYVAVWADERRRTEERSIRLPLGNCAAAPFVTNTGLRDLVLSRR